MRHTEKSGHIIMVKLQGGEATGKYLHIYVGACESANCPSHLVTTTRIVRMEGSFCDVSACAIVQSHGVGAW